MFGNVRQSYRNKSRNGTWWVYKLNKIDIIGQFFVHLAQCDQDFCTVLFHSYRVDGFVFLFFNTEITKELRVPNASARTTHSGYRKRSRSYLW